MKLCLLDLANSNTIYLSIQILISGQVTKNLEKNSLFDKKIILLSFVSQKRFRIDSLQCSNEALII